MDEFTNIGDMAEVLGAVASGIAIGQLAASIARSIIAIKEGRSQVQDAPAEIGNLIRQIDSLNRILQHIEDDQSREDIKKQTWPWVRVEQLGTIFFCPGYHPEKFLLGRVSSIKNLNGNGITQLILE